MKKTIAVVLALLMVFAFAGTALAVKPTGNLAGAEEVSWNLSGDVMPVPPWGLIDIPGSDTASKLIVNQPNGNTEVAVTGVMRGLDPNTEYIVYPSNAWSTSEKWNITGDWSIEFLLGSGNYDHQMTVTFQNMHEGYFSGTGVYIPNDGYTWTIDSTSRVVGDTVTLDLTYTGINPGYTVHAVGTIDSSGYLVNGTWSSSSNQNGTWSSFEGQATKETVGNGWPGLFPGQETFTFLTDEYGAASWHFNLKNADFSGSGVYDLSIWVNKGGSTILVSDNFEVVVD